VLEGTGAGPLAVHRRAAYVVLHYVSTELVVRVRPASASWATRVAAPSGGADIETLRVSAGSRPNAVAGAIAALLRQTGAVEVQAIGPHAVNQAVKSLAVARSYLEGDALDLTTTPSFVKLELHDEERTAVRFDVVAVPRPEAPQAVDDADTERPPQ
jgi:stage V sporulation protein S